MSCFFPSILLHFSQNVLHRNLIQINQTSFLINIYWMTNIHIKLIMHS